MKSFVKLLTLVFSAFFIFPSCSGAAVYLTYEEGDYEILDGDAVSSESFDAIEIRWGRGDVNIVAGDHDGVLIFEDYEQPNSPATDELARYCIEDGKLVIQFCAPKKLLSGIKKNLTVSISNSLAEMLSDIAVVSTAGALLIDSVCSDNINIVTAGGSISMQSVSASGIDIDMASASLNFNYVSVSDKLSLVCASADISMKETDADILSLSGMSCDLDVEGNLEVVDIDATSVNAKLLLNGERISRMDGNFVSGNVTVYLSEEMDGFKAKIEGLSTSFSTDFETRKRGEEYIYGNGRAVFSFSGASGSLEIQKITE